MRALLIPDDRGQGHIVRCGALAEALRDAGWETLTIGRREWATVSGEHFDVAVFDLVDYMSPVPGIKWTVRIVDDYETQPWSSDLTVQGNSGRGNSERSTTIVPLEVLIGEQYAMLRPEFRVKHPNGHVRDGIFDARNLAGWPAQDMAEIFTTSMVVITYGGMRALEAAACGAPLVLVARNHGERKNAQGLMFNGCGVTTTEGEAEHVASFMVKHPEMLKRMSMSGLSLVDGKGCERVVKAIGRMVAE